MEEQNQKRKRFSGSDVILLVMYAGWIWYICFVAFIYINANAWMPIEITIGTVLLFLYETFALYKLKLAREDGKTTKEAICRTDPETSTMKEWIAGKIGLSSTPTLDIEIEEALDKTRSSSNEK